MKTTPWFDAATQNPVRVGVYEVQATERPVRYAHWDGFIWSMMSSKATSALCFAGLRSEFMYDPGSKWRGLLK